METRNRRLDQWWQFCTCHDLSMSHGRSRTGQIPLRLLLTTLSMGKLKIQIWAQDDNCHPPAWCLCTSLLKETQPSESKPLRNLKRQHPNPFNVFWIIELMLNPDSMRTVLTLSHLKQHTAHPRKPGGIHWPLPPSTCKYACLGVLRETPERFELEGTFKGHLIQAPCHEQGHLQLDQIFQIFFKSTERNQLPALFHLPKVRAT